MKDVQIELTKQDKETLKGIGLLILGGCMLGYSVGIKRANNRLCKFFSECAKASEKGNEMFVTTGRGKNLKAYTCIATKVF